MYFSVFDRWAKPLLGHQLFNPCAFFSWSPKASWSVDSKLVTLINAVVECLRVCNIVTGWRAFRLSEQGCHTRFTNNRE